MNFESQNALLKTLEEPPRANLVRTFTCVDGAVRYVDSHEPDVPYALKLLQGRGIDLDDMQTSYFLSRDQVVPTLRGGMALWREKLFASMHRNASAAADFLSLPTNRIVELGSKVEI